MAETKENSLSKTFVGFVLERASAAPKIKDTGFVARMKRADNPDLEYQVWNILLKFNVDNSPRGVCRSALSEPPCAEGNRKRTAYSASARR